VIGSVSRFVPRKHQNEVITAADELFAGGLPVRVSIVGRGRLEARLRAQAAAVAVPVDFHVDVPWDELPELYRGMNVFAVPTRSRWLGLEAEGLGIVFLEAAASGLPVIAGSSGGAPETVIPGETGYVVHDYAGLVEGLRLLVANPTRRREMGAAGRRYMEERYSWESVMERLNSALERAVNPAS
jgi:phosphatidylinositol alpha-1,6-mannosyltransferase